MEPDAKSAGICPKCGSHNKVREKKVKGYEVLLWRCPRCGVEWADIGGEVTKKNKFKALKGL